MDESHLDRSMQFAAFLIGGVLFLVFGVEFLVEGVIDYIVECTNLSFSGECSGNQVWQNVAPIIGGTILSILAILFFLLAYRVRRVYTVRQPVADYLPPPPP
jgi:hypothetical protein